MKVFLAIVALLIGLHVSLRFRIDHLKRAVWAMEKENGELWREYRETVKEVK